jgi:hypothetical protein
VASFTERATLEVKDKSTSQIRKINSELKKLQATARSLRTIRIDITGLSAATRQVNNLTRALGNLKKVSTSLNIRVGTQGLSQAQRQISTLRNSARRPINVRVNYSGNQPPRLPPHGGGPRSRGGGSGSRGRSFFGTAMQGASAGAGGGMGFGLMGGLAAINPAFLAVAAAAYAAAAALKYVGQQGAKADRADLMMRMAATKEQQPIIQAAVDKYAEGDRALGMSKADMKMFITGILGDVGGKNATERATAAANIAPVIADKFLPLAYALGGPDVTKEAAIKDLAVIVKGLNIASGDLTTAAGQLSKDGLRVFEGVALAKAMNPLLDSERIRTTLANLKTLAFTMQPEALARLLSSSGDRGVRVANELYQAVRSMSGTVDNKALNRALSKLGLLEGGTPITTPKGKVKTGQGAGMVLGSQKPIDAEFRQRDPFGWMIKYVLPKIEADAKKSITKAEAKAAEERARQVKEEGGTAEEIAEARAPLRSKIQSVMDSMFTGMAATARTALSDTIFGHAQARGAIEQGKDVLKQDPKAIFAASWTAQLEKLKTTLETRAQDAGDSVAQAIGLDKKIAVIEEAIRTKDYGQLGKAVTMGMNTLDTLLTPSKLSAELLYKGALKLWEVGVALAKKFNIVEDTSPEGKAAAAKALEETQLRAIADKPVMSRTEKEVQKLIDYGRSLNEKRQAQIDEAMRRGDKAGTAGLLKDIHNANVTITTMMASIGTFKVPDKWGLGKPGFPSPTSPKPIDAGKPFDSPVAPNWVPDFKTTLDDFKATGGNWVTDMLNVPTKFEATFETLKQAGVEGGNNFGTNANSAITAGAAEGGGIFGSTAITTIKAGLANLNLSAHINVSGVTQTGDKGARPAD